MTNNDQHMVMFFIRVLLLTVISAVLLYVVKRILGSNTESAFETAWLVVLTVEIARIKFPSTEK